jgi:nitrite reductase/ring-hydroxylating ferredoxin subunit
VVSAATPTPTPVPAPTSRRRLGPVDEIPPGEARAFVVDGEQVAVFRLRDGSVRGLSAVCPHRGGPMADGQFDGRVVICPLHLNAFDLDTGCSTTGAEALHRFDVAVEGPDVVLYMS